MNKLLMTGVLCLIPSPVFAQGPGGIDNTRDTIAKWVETERIISKEKKDWVLGRELLNQQIELVQGRIDSLVERITAAEEDIATTEEKQAELVRERDRLKEASDALSATVAALEDRAKQLLRRLPDPLVEQIKPFSQALPDDSSSTGISLGDRFQNLVGILTAINKFNGAITVTSEVRVLADGTTAEVTALYIGIGQGYYVTGNREAAGVGIPSDDGWIWTAANDSVEAISAAISIWQNEKVAEFVPLPVRIR